jgi:hypothetical protein
LHSLRESLLIHHKIQCLRLLWAFQRSFFGNSFCKQTHFGLSDNRKLNYVGKLVLSTFWRKDDLSHNREGWHPCYGFSCGRANSSMSTLQCSQQKSETTGFPTEIEGM